MKSQVELLEQDLKSIQSEFKKKNTQIKDSCDVALKVIEQRTEKLSNSTKNIAADSNQLKDLLEPLTFIFQTKSTKQYALAVSSLQKVAQLFSITDVLDMLREASSDLIDEMTQIRVLQLLLTFLDPKTTVLSKEFVNNVLQCCFQMFETKSNAVKSTIQATLKTLTTLITDTFISECRNCKIPIGSERQGVTDSDQVAKVKLSKVFEVVHDLLQKIAFTLIIFEQAINPSKKAAISKQVIWNLKPSQNAKCVVLDLTNLIITQTKGSLCLFDSVINIFELQIIPTLLMMLQTKQTNSLVGLRQMKSAMLIIQNLHVGINLLQPIIAEADTLSVQSKDGTQLLLPSWKSLIGFECLQLAMSNAELTKKLSLTNFPNRSSPILIQVLETYLKAARAIEANPSSDQQQQYIGTQRIAKFIDSQQIDSELTTPSTQQIERIIIESICAFSDNFVHVFQAIGVKLGTVAGSLNRSQNFQEQDNDSETMCKQLLQMSWRPLLDSIQCMMKSHIDEASCQMLLKSYQQCIGACGSANCYDARDAFLQSLCSQCVSMPTSISQQKKPLHFEYQITERNILVCKTLLNIAHCLCHILDVKSWFVILETMQNIELVTNRRGTTNETPFKQPLINFTDLRQTVQLRMQEQNLHERQQNRGQHNRISSISKNPLKVTQIHPTPDERALEIQILMDSINSLFTSSLLFDQQSLQELVCALAQLMVTKLQDVNGGEILDFGLRRLFETSLVNVGRIDIFWKIIIAHLEILQQSKDATVRQYTIEALQLLTIEIFTFKKQSEEQNLFDQSNVQQDSDNSEAVADEQWVYDAWQYTVLQPFGDILKTANVNDKVLVLKCLEKIIQQCGQQIRNDGWRIIILSISKSLEAEVDQVTTCGFRCLKLIVGNYISKLSIQNFRTVLNAIHLYASNRGDNINNNLIAISMFQNVADFIARQIKAEAFQFRQTWIILFERIKDLAQDHRAEVRRANIHTLDNIVMTHGATFATQDGEDDEVWPIVLDDVMLGMLDQAIGRYEQNQSSQTLPLQQSSQTPQFSTQKKINFEEASVVSALKKHDEQWQDTCSILAETACRSFKKFVSLSVSPERGAQFWENLVVLLCRLLEDTESGMDLCKTIFKSLSDLAPICSAIISQDSINQLLKVTKSLVETEIEQSHDDKNMVLRLLKSVPVLVEALRKVYEQTELFERNTDSLYQLLTQLTKCSGSNDGYLGFGQPNKLLSEEKVVFDFVEVLCSPTLAYYEFLSQFLVFDKLQPRSEAYIRRSLPIFFDALLKGKICNNTLFFKVIPNLCQAISELIELRYDTEAAKILIFQAKGQPTLFYTCGIYLILIASFLINPDQFKARIWAHQSASNESKLGAPKQQTMAIGETGGLQGIEDQSVLQKYPLMSAERSSELQEDMLFAGIEFVLPKITEIQVDVYKSQSVTDSIWSLTQTKLVAVLQFTPSRLKQSTVLSEVQKSSQDLDIQLINFIVNCLLPNSIDHASADFETHLVSVIDQGCQQLSSNHATDSLGKYCLNNLFRLSKQQVWSQQHNDIREKIALLTTPILINRCRITLRKYIQDEQKAGVVRLPQVRVQEVQTILRKLYELESNNKDHLIQLMPLFAEMVLSNEQSLKEVLCQILLEISSLVQKIYPEKQRCSSGGN